MEEYTLISLSTTQVGRLYDEHMVEDFPPSERPKRDQMVQMVREGSLCAYRMTGSDGVDVAYAMAVTRGEAVLYTHLAVFPGVRGGGIGSRLLQLLDDAFADAQTQIVEVENPAAAGDAQDAQTMRRRIAFYQRGGYQIVPRLRFILFGVDMLLMTRTRDGAPTPPEQAERTMREIYYAQLPPALRGQFDMTVTPRD